MAVPVHVLGGFLGAGKTTTLVGLLEGPLASERVAVVVNDFGQSAVDEATVGDRGVAIEEIRGSCVCCTAPEGFMAAVGRLLDEQRPDRILVEPTGLAVPSDLVDTLRRAPYADRLDLRPLLVLVDPVALGGPHGHEVRDQAADADVLVANRTDRCSPEQLAAFDRWAAELWPGPLTLHHTVRGRLPASVLDWPPDAGARAQRSGGCALHHDHHDHLEGWQASSWTWPPDVVFSRRRLLDALDALASRSDVARLKGMFRTDEGWSRLELAGGDRDEAATRYRRDSRVDVIGRGADEEAIRAVLAAAVLTDEERARSRSSVEVALPDGSSRRFDREALAALPGGVADVAPLLPGRVGSAARVAAVFDALGVDPGWSAVVVAADGFTTEPVPASALEPGLLLHSLDGGPLPAKQGGPVRLMIPGDAGPGGPCANVKAVVRIALRA